MTTEDVEELVSFLRQWEDAGAFGHIVLSVRPHDNDPDMLGLVSYCTFGPEEDSDDHLKLVAFMDKILDAVGTKVGRN